MVAARRVEHEPDIRVVRQRAVLLHLGMNLCKASIQYEGQTEQHLRTFDGLTVGGASDVQQAVDSGLDRKHHLIDARCNKDSSEHGVQTCVRMCSALFLVMVASSSRILAISACSVAALGADRFCNSKHSLALSSHSDVDCGPAQWCGADRFCSGQ